MTSSVVPKSQPARRRGAALAVVLVAGIIGAPAPVRADVLDLVRAAPAGTWIQANQNAVSTVWTPPALRNTFDVMGGEMNRIIYAWSSFAWDSTRSSLIIYGGGHANYGSNDVYTWNGGTLLWERSSLPSLTVQAMAGSYTYGFPADGSLNAPAAAHTYDNTVYLKASDRYLTFGGAAWNNGGSYVKNAGDGTFPRTGPYLFDPAKADPNKVGGTTGSGVNPSTLGSQAWSNRDYWAYNPSVLKPKSFVDGFSDSTVINGKDVIYVGGAQDGTAMDLFRYTIHDPNNPALDTWEFVGRNNNTISTGDSAGALDTSRNMFVRTGDAGKQFLAWNLNTPGSQNSDIVISPTDLTGGQAPTNWRGYGFAFDDARDYFVAWKGNGDVWVLQPPSGGFSGVGWTVDRLDVNGGTTPGALNTIQVLGKWQYAADLDAYVTLQGPTTGDVWIYKPEGWLDPALAVPELPPALMLLAGLALMVGVKRYAERRH